jgi:hypothetical protein
MATATGKAHCITCGKEKVAYKCEGCSQNFCINHLNEHHQLIIKQFDDLENKRNIFRQNLTEQITYPQKHSLLKEINQWEKDSINKIQQIAEETRQLLIKYTNEYMNQIEIRLIKLTEELKQIRQEDDFNEINLNQLNQKLQQLEEELDKPSNISIQQESSTFINKIFVITPFDKGNIIRFHFFIIVIHIIHFCFLEKYFYRYKCHLFFWKIRLSFEINLNNKFQFISNNITIYNFQIEK